MSDVRVNRVLPGLRRRGLFMPKVGRPTILGLLRPMTTAEVKSDDLHFGDQAAA